MVGLYFLLAFVCIDRVLPSRLDHGTRTTCAATGRRATTSRCLPRPPAWLQFRQIGVVINLRQGGRITSAARGRYALAGCHANQRLRVSNPENPGAALIEHLDIHLRSREPQPLQGKLNGIVHRAARLFDRFLVRHDQFSN